MGAVPGYPGSPMESSLWQERRLSAQHLLVSPRSQASMRSMGLPYTPVTAHEEEDAYLNYISEPLSDDPVQNVRIVAVCS